MVDKALRSRNDWSKMKTAKRSTSTQVEPHQAARLGGLIRSRREELGLSTRQLAERAGMNFATVARIEQGQFAAPGPDKLAGIAEALGLNAADLFGLADYTVPDDLPSFQPYLRSKYRDMPREAVDDLNKAFARIVHKHGYDPNGPRDGEDEHPEKQPCGGKKGRGKQMNQPTCPNCTRSIEKGHKHIKMPGGWCQVIDQPKVIKSKVITG